MKNIIKAITEFFGMLIGVKSASAVDARLVDYSGQGRNQYGK